MRSKKTIKQRLGFYHARIDSLQQHYEQELGKSFQKRDKAYMHFLLNEISVYQSICDELDWVLV